MSDLALAWAVAQTPGAEDASTAIGSSEAPAGDEVADHAKNSGIDLASVELANSDLASADPMEEFKEPVAPAWLLVAVEDARAGASQEN